jgi:hypothetical protein
MSTPFDLFHLYACVFTGKLLIAKRLILMTAKHEKYKSTCFDSKAY